MAHYVPDSNTRRWVIVAPGRGNRPNDIKKEIRDTQYAIRSKEIEVDTSCPFCGGNEAMTPPEVMRIGDGNPNTVGWDVRVVPNKFPITDIHEVFIHSVHHATDISLLSESHIEKVILAYKMRYLANASKGHVLIFCNQGKAAGASLQHPHAQLVVVPQQIQFDALSREAIVNEVIEDHGFVVYCPEFSQWPYETWITKTGETDTFGDLTDVELPVVAHLLSTTLKRLRSVLSDEYPSQEFSYNYYISSEKHWFIRIIPRMVERAGFELGTGLSVNPVAPADAAHALKEVV